MGAHTRLTCGGREPPCFSQEMVAVGDPDTRQYSRTVEPSCTSVRSGLTCTWGSPAPAGGTGSVPAPG